MATTFQINLTNNLLGWINKNKKTIGTLGIYLQNVSAPSNGLVNNQWLPLSKLTKKSNNLYQFTANSGNAARIYVGVPTAAPIKMGSTLIQQTNSQPGYLYAYGETNFNVGGFTNMDTSVIDSFGLPYSIQALNAKGTPTGTIHNAGVGLGNKPYNYAYWSAASTGKNLEIYNRKNSGGIVPPSFSKSGYHDFSNYYGYLSNLSQKNNYTAWLKRGDTKWYDKRVTKNIQEFDGRAAFFGFNGKSGAAGSGYILIGGNVANGSTANPFSVQTPFSILIPWSTKDLNKIGLSSLTQQYNNTVKYNNNLKPGHAAHPVGNLLSQYPYIYQNDVTGFYTEGVNIFKNAKGQQLTPKQINNQLIKKTFKNALVYDTSAQPPDWNSPSTPQMAQMVGDLFYGLNKGLVGSSVDFVTGFSANNQPYSGVNKTMQIGQLPSEAWYTTDIISGNQASSASAAWLGKNGPVKSGLWGGWAWPQLASKGTQNFWNNYSFMLNGKLPTNKSQYVAKNGFGKAQQPLFPNTYTWAMDDRMGGQLLGYENGLQMTIDAPQFTPGANPIG